jgi:hypothetical protein
MKRKIFRRIALRSVALVLVLGADWQARAQDAKALYPKMAPLEQYLTADQNDEIALARSAAPESISGDAEILVLGRHGYETAVKGKNGFVCVVERSWMVPIDDDPEFWNPKMRAPTCYNPQAAQSILPLTFKKTGLVLAGLSKAQIIDGFKPSGRNELPPLAPGAMSYMMSRQGYLSDAAGHAVPHLMFYLPHVDGTAWGADLPGSPVMLALKQFPGAAEPVTMFIIAVHKWSDGTAASTDHH